MLLLLALVAASTPRAATTVTAAPQGPVAAYSFDAGSGASAADATGNGNTGTITNAVWTTAGKHGGALVFDGTSSYVTVADRAALDLTTALTVEAWVYPTSSSAGSAAIVAKERTGGGMPYGLETTGGAPDAYVNVGATASSGGAAALPLNAWSHVAATYDGTTLALYVNGTQVSSATAAGPLSTSADPLRIGADLTWGEYFDGRIDDVRLYDHALSGAEVQTDMNTGVAPPAPPPPPAPAPPVAAFSFDAGTGTTASDDSGNGHTGTLSNAGWTAAGKFGGALSFNGSSSYVTVPDGAALDFSTSLTLEAWVYPTASGAGSSGILAKERTGGGLPYGVETTGGNPDAYVNAGGTTVASSSAALPLNTWSHVASTFDGTTLRLYVNGTQVASTPAVGPIAASADPLRIGADLTWGEYFDGRIDNVRVYNRALAAAEVQTDMNTAVTSTSPPPTPDTQAPSVPTGLAKTGATATSVSLSWTASTDNVGVTGYGVYNGGTQAKTSTTTSTTVSGLTCGTTYTFAVDAYDAAGNRSAKSSTVSAATASCGDTQPPSAPTGLQKTGSSETTITVSWNAATDNVGVTGYDVYRNGGVISTTGGTTFIYSGLACSTSYTLGISAYDAAGNRSPVTSISASTSTCTGGGTAGVFLSPGGSDSNPCTQAAPCRSFDRGYHVAQPGDIVQLAAGSYGSQDLYYDASKTSATDVVFQPAAGAAVSVGQLEFGPDRFVRGASHVTVKDITVTQDVQIVGCGAADTGSCYPQSSSGGDDITLQNLRVQGPYAFYCASCSNVNIIGGVWGPPTYACRSGLGSAHPEVQNAYLQTKRSNHILIDGAIFQNFARCTTGDHTECMQMEPADDVTVRNSIFRYCDTLTVNFANDLAFGSKSAAGYEAPNNLLLENNFFDAAMDNTGGPTWYAVNVRECTNCTVRYNSWLQAPRMPTGQISLNNKYIGNVGPMTQWTCNVAGVTWAYNVWDQAQCSPTDKQVSDFGFVNPAAVDLHLKPGSPAINAGDPSFYPARDIDGQSRPLGGAPDAGADEAA
jgi:chitodextrinase